MKRKVLFGSVVATVALSASVLASTAGTAAKPAASTAHLTSSAATISSPIGPITPAENTYLHTHPVNMTKYQSDAGYRAQVLGKPAPIQLESRRTFWGYFCAGYGIECLGTWGGAGGDIFFTSGVRGNANAEWNQWWFGQVGPSWPVPSTQFYTHFRNDSVYQYCYAPHGVGTGECITTANGVGQPLKVEHATNSMDELFVWTGSHHWVATLWTGDSFQNLYDRGITYWVTASMRNNGRNVYVSNHAYAGLSIIAFPGG